MKSDEVVALVLQLLSEGRSQRVVAVAAGVSRGFVAGVAAGKIAANRCSSKQEVAGPTPPTVSRVCLETPHRGRVCGGLVYGECYLCKVREIKGQNGTLLARVRSRSSYFPD